MACRVLKVLRSGYYEWRDRPLSPRDVDNAYLANTVVDIHTASREGLMNDRICRRGSGGR